MMTLKIILKDAANCWLSLLMSQPMDFDLIVLFKFLLEYSGVFVLYGLVRNLVQALPSPAYSLLRKSSSEVPTC
jgi:hypothetical protein